MTDFPIQSQELPDATPDNFMYLPDSEVSYFEVGFSPEINELKDDDFRDAAVLVHEYEERRRAWWRWRFPLAVGLFFITAFALVIWFLMLIVRNDAKGLFFWIFVIGLIASLLFAGYCWFTLPRLTYFARHYRRFVASPLTKNGLIWSDPTLTPPDFPSLRDTFYTLYRDSDDLSSKIKPDMQEETERKKLLLSQLTRLLTPLLEARSSDEPTPFISSSKVNCLDEVALTRLNVERMPQILPNCIPIESISADKKASEFNRLALEIEDYSGLNTTLLPVPILQEGETDTSAENVEIVSIAASDLADPKQNVDLTGSETGTSIEAINIGVSTTSLVKSASPVVSQTVHQQIIESVTRNLGLVERETERWREHADHQKEYDANLIDQYNSVEQVVENGYNRIITSLENEVRPALERLNSDTDFYYSQITRFYDEQRHFIEGERDTALSKLDREHADIIEQRDQMQYELSLAEAELNNLKSRRDQLDHSTDLLFLSLKNQMFELTNRNYTLPSPPHFRSDLLFPATATSTEEVLHNLAELRADTRFVTKTINNALNRYASINFEPLDELGHLERDLANSTKWQAVRWLGDFINFRQSGQLLELASDVSNAVSGYLEASTEFERMNERWSSLANSIQNLGLTSYSNRLEEAQQNLADLAELLQSLYSSLVQAPHSPEMARPATFQNLYELSAGLRRGLDELSGLGGAITHSEERVADLQTDVHEIEGLVLQNEEEDNRVRQEAASKIVNLLGKQEQILEKLSDLSQARETKIRSHIVALEYERDNKLDELRIGTVLLTDCAEISTKILQKHLSRTDNILDEIHHLQQKLENNLEGIVTEFEQSVVLGRCLPRASELYVPVWLSEFEERPVWSKTVVRKASCFRELNLTNGYYAKDVKKKRSFWGFVLNRSTTFFQLQPDEGLNDLVQTDHLAPPFNRNFGTIATFRAVGIDRLISVGWMNNWLAPVLRHGINKE